MNSNIVDQLRIKYFMYTLNMTTEKKAVNINCYYCAVYGLDYKVSTDPRCVQCFPPEGREFEGFSVYQKCFLTYCGMGREGLGYKNNINICSRKY